MSTRACLGIETSGTVTGLALVRQGRVLARLVEGSGCNHNETLLPLLDRLLAEAHLSPRGISGIGVCIGPGMFTSLRVGLSAAKGLAVAHGIPVAGVGTLWALARTVSPQPDQVLSIIDARKQQIYAALYLDGSAAIRPTVLSPGELVSAVKPLLGSARRVAVAGSGAGICAGLLQTAGIGLDMTGIENPCPAVVALEAEERIIQDRADDIAQLEPVYLRRTDAELNRERQLHDRT